MSDATCKTCPWFAPGPTIVGGCHVAPPVGDASVPWPGVGPDDWCGEHPARIVVITAELRDCRVLDEEGVRRILHEELRRMRKVTP